MAFHGPLLMSSESLNYSLLFQRSITIEHCHTYLNSEQGLLHHWWAEAVRALLFNLLWCTVRFKRPGLWPHCWLICNISTPHGLTAHMPFLAIYLRLLSLIFIPICVIDSDKQNSVFPICLHLTFIVNSCDEVQGFCIVSVQKLSIKRFYLTIQWF